MRLSVGGHGRSQVDVGGDSHGGGGNMAEEVVDMTIVVDMTEIDHMKEADMAVVHVSQ